MKWEFRECEKGDMIRVALGNLYHYGIFICDSEVIAFGYPPLPRYAEQNESVTVVATDIDTFACGNIVEAPSFSLKEKLKKNSAEAIAQKARARLGEGGYNIIHNNCEHFVYECVFNKHYSAQEEAARQKWARFSKAKS